MNWQLIGTDAAGRVWGVWFFDSAQEARDFIANHGATCPAVIAWQVIDQAAEYR